MVVGQRLSTYMNKEGDLDRAKIPSIYILPLL